MDTAAACTAARALERLKEGNKRYMEADVSGGDISRKRRIKTLREGQAPYAVIVTCSDSRVIPESIFDAGIGDLFVIRVAGNVMDDHQLGSVEYAAEHLGSRLVVVMGHDHCGAVDAAIHHDPQGFIKFITDEIREAVGEETDDLRACRLNVRHSVRVIEDSLKIRQEDEIKVCGAIYHLEDGSVEFL